MRIEAQGDDLVVLRDPADSFPSELSWWHAVRTRMFGTYDVATSENKYQPRVTCLRSRTRMWCRVNNLPLADEWATGRVLLSDR